jgi:hypothetical protein
MLVQGAANFFLRQSAFGSYGAKRFAISKPSASVARLFVIGPMTTPNAQPEHQLGKLPTRLRQNPHSGLDSWN